MSKIGLPENGRGPAETGWPCEIWRGQQGRLEVFPRNHSREHGGSMGKTYVQGEYTLVRV